MKNKFRFCVGFTSAVLLMGTSLLPSLAQGLLFSHKEVDEVAVLRRAAHHYTPEQFPAISGAINRKYKRGFWLVGLRAAAESGDIAFVPVLDDFLKKNEGEMGAVVRVVRARLIAENETKNIAPKNEQAKITLLRFYKEVQLTAPQINEVIARPEDRRNFHAERSLEGDTLEQLALREIADMIYRGDAATWLALPEIKELNFARDMGAALKIKLAPLSLAKRIQWLIEDLAAQKILGAEEDFKFQLAIDEGTAAAQVALEKLTEIDRNRKAYLVKTTDGMAHFIGYTALFRVVCGAGNQAQLNALKPYQKDPEPDIADNVSPVLPTWLKVYVINY